uniref:Prepilin-type N-terminal cleavage/methylation domain-containing protein n=1 Tax=Desulfovibrio sp. U5L TaxID=596152 RepID=I2Q4Q5_9BACT
MKRTLAARGFTLIEILLTFVLFGLVALMAVSYFGVGMTRTDIAKNQLQTDATLQLVMENMIAAQATSAYNADLKAFDATLGTVGVPQSTYGNGASYLITEKTFVCPSGSTFVANADSNQFLLVTIKPDANSGVSLTYLFSSNLGNCNVAGGGS